MIGEIRDPELSGLWDDWHPPLPGPEMHERIRSACEKELRRPVGTWPLAAVAALILIVVYAAPRIEMRSPGSVNTAQIKQDQPSMPVTPERATVSVLRKTPAPRPRSVTRKPIQTSDHPAGRPMTRFYSLMDAAPPLGDGLLVRVTVPPSALQIAGILVSDSQMNGRVEADVLIGEDGIARAIRFLGFE